MATRCGATIPMLHVPHNGLGGSGLFLAHLVKPLFHQQHVLREAEHVRQGSHLAGVDRRLRRSHPRRRRSWRVHVVELRPVLVQRII